MKNFRMADWINILESRRYGLVTRRKGRENRIILLKRICPSKSPSWRESPKKTVDP